MTFIENSLTIATADHNIVANASGLLEQSVKGRSPMEAKRVIDVQTGQVRGSQGKVVLRAVALGSCLAIVLYDPVRKNGAMAHVMLPGKAPAKAGPLERTKYAADAIDALVEIMKQMGSGKNDFCVAVIGGANVLKRKNDTIARDNVESNFRILEEKKLNIVARHIGGYERRNASIDLEKGIISYAEGDSIDKELWRA